MSSQRLNGQVSPNQKICSLISGRNVLVLSDGFVYDFLFHMGHRYSTVVSRGVIFVLAAGLANSLISNHSNLDFQAVKSNLFHLFPEAIDALFNFFNQLMAQLGIFTTLSTYCLPPFCWLHSVRIERLCRKSLDYKFITGKTLG